MVKEEILTKLRSAEEETAKRVASAKEQANEILKSARREAEDRIAKAQEEARKSEDQKTAAERQGLEKKREQILGEGANQERALRASYQKKVDKHVQKALETFERSA